MIENVTSRPRTSWPRHGRYSFYTSLASFAVVCFILTLLSDLAYWVTASVLWSSTSVWLLTIGLLAGALAILTGIVDLIRSRRISKFGQISGLRQPWLIVLGQVIACGLSVVNVFVHSRDGYTAVVPQGLVLSCLAVLVLLMATLMTYARASRTHLASVA